MGNVTQVLSKIDSSDRGATEQLLPLVYEELRKLAAAKLAHEKPGQTLQATALVHEAYIRLVGAEAVRPWNSRGHFFATAAEAMRRILVEVARKKKTQKRGGDWNRIALDDVASLAIEVDDLLLLDEALRRLAKEDELGARLVELRYFAGLSVEQAAESVGASAATAYRHWAFARAWLHNHIGKLQKKL